MSNFSATHLIPAVALEVKEVKRTAKVGESIRVLTGPYSDTLGTHLLEVLGTVYGGVKVKLENTGYHIRNEYYTVAEPTGIVIVNGTRYVTEEFHLGHMEQMNKAIKDSYEAGKRIGISTTEAELQKLVAEETPVIPPKPRLTRQTVIEIAKKSMRNLMDEAAGEYRFIFKGDPDTRIVTCTMMERAGKLIRTGTAKCDESDQYDYYIGSVIAIHRALELTVPDMYINVPQFEGTTTGRYI